MPTTPIRCNKQRSGNHGRDNTTNTGSAPPTATGSTIPQQSNAAFVAPPMPQKLKKIVPIKDVIEDKTITEKEPEPTKTETTPTIIETQTAQIETASTETDVASIEIETKETEADVPVSMHELKPSAQFNDKVEKVAAEITSTNNVSTEQQLFDNQGVTQNENSSNGNFTEVWQKMLEVVFAQVPQVLFTLKTIVPKIENNIVNVPVASQIQANYFNSKQGESLQFLRQNFSSELEDIRVTITTEAQTEKLIYTNEEKLAYFKETNAELQEFMQILNLRGNF